ncbi:hypothetical protein BDR07DRAFT_1616840 [Suillus spraguei]|nr:hypothetical protein BDR07DRAFT_1616840 [Suillus spraguei]
MAASSKPTEEIFHPSSLLAYDALSYHQGSDSIISDAKITADTKTDFYDRSLTSRRYALVGVACSSIFSCSCIVAGIVIVANYGTFGVFAVNLEIFVHGIALRSALASESRLHFNTNLRLLSAARGWYNPNGAPA